MARQEYTAETKAAVLAALLAGQSVSEVARAYKIPSGTVKSWSAQLDREQPVATTKKERIGELLVGYLEHTLEALTAQARVFADPTWLRTQTASELAVLHGVQTDKAIRLLEAMSTADGDGAAS